MSAPRRFPFDQGIDQSLIDATNAALRDSMLRGDRDTALRWGNYAAPNPTRAADNKTEDPVEKKQQTATIAAVAPTEFLSTNKELLESGKYADAKVVANGKTYNVHKAVLCPRSKWFRAALDGKFREGAEGVVEISDAENIERVLEFLYTGAVDLTKDKDLMASANELFVLGDFYMSEEMTTYAGKVLAHYLGEHLNEICDVERSASLPTEHFQDQPQGEGCFTRRRPLRGDIREDPVFNYYIRRENFKILVKHGFVEHLCSAIRDAYNTSSVGYAAPAGIHRVYVDFVYAARIHTFPEPSIQKLKGEIPEFTSDLMDAMMTGPQSKALEGNEAFEQWKDGTANPEDALSRPQRYRRNWGIDDYSNDYSRGYYGVGRSSTRLA